MGKHILIVEDELVSQSILKRMLEHIDSDVWVQCVSTAEEAYEALNEAEVIRQPFDFVIADLYLPETNGLALWQKVQKLYPAIDFLFISGTTHRDWENRIYSLPVWPPFIRKPVTEESLKMFWQAYLSNEVTLSG